MPALSGTNKEQNKCSPLQQQRGWKCPSCSFRMQLNFSALHILFNSHICTSFVSPFSHAKTMFISFVYPHIFESLSHRRTFALIYVTVGLTWIFQPYSWTVVTLETEPQESQLYNCNHLLGCLTLPWQTLNVHETGISTVWLYVFRIRWVKWVTTKRW